MLTESVLNYGLGFIFVSGLLFLLYLTSILPQGASFDRFSWMKNRGFWWEFFAGSLNNWTLAVLWTRLLMPFVAGGLWGLFVFWFYACFFYENVVPIAQLFIIMLSHLSIISTKPVLVFALPGTVSASTWVDLQTYALADRAAIFIPEYWLLFGQSDLSFDPYTGILFSSGDLIAPLIRSFFVFVGSDAFGLNEVIFFYKNWLALLTVTAPQTIFSNACIFVVRSIYAFGMVFWINFGWFFVWASAQLKSLIPSIRDIIVMLSYVPDSFVEVPTLGFLIFFTYRLIVLSFKTVQAGGVKTDSDFAASVLGLFFLGLSALQFKAIRGYYQSVWWQIVNREILPKIYAPREFLIGTDDSPITATGAYVVSKGVAILVFFKNWFFISFLNKSLAVGIVRLSTGFLDSIFFSDWVSFWLIFLTVFTILVCSFAMPIFRDAFAALSGGRSYRLTLLWIGFCMVIAFSTSNLLVFYCAFEGVLIPTFFMIGAFGSAVTRVPAAFRLLLFTVAGSIAFLLAMAIVYVNFGTFNFWELQAALNGADNLQFLIFFLLFVGLSFKVPMYPFYLWLTSAHVEAPTAGSMILAGLMLKLGIYGLLRFAFQLCPVALSAGYQFVVLFPLIGFTVISYLMCVVNDVKRVIAYSSISHMNFLLVALVAGGDIGFAAAIFTMISHAFVSMGLFYIIGCVYRRTDSRHIFTFSGLATSAPRLAAFLILFLFSNAGLPLFAGFPGELLSFIAIWELNPTIFILALPGFFFIIFAMFRVIAGLLGSEHSTRINPQMSDLTQTETAICWLFTIWQFLGALAPFFFISPVL